MATLGNIIWFIFFGWWNFLVYALCGVLFCITIIGIPIGKALFQYAKLMAFPFGKVIVRETFIKGAENVSVIRKIGGTIANIIWLPVGIITFIENIGLMLLCFISIIGIPAGFVIAKSCTFLLWPIGAKVISKNEALAIQTANLMRQNTNYHQNTNQVQSISQTQSTNQVPYVSQTQNTNYNQVSASTQTNMPAYKEESLHISGQDSIEKEQNQTLENLKAGGIQALESLKETSEKTVTAIKKKSEEGMSSFIEYQSQTAQKSLAHEKGYTLEVLLEEVEAKLYHNKIMAWVMPIAEYITIFVSVLCMIIAVVSTLIFIPDASVSYMIHLGFYIATPFLWVAALLGMIKKNHILVLSSMGLQAFDKVICLLFGIDGRIAAFLLLLCYGSIIAWYIFAFLNKGRVPNNNSTSDSLRMPNITGAQTSEILFCSQCGEKHSSNTVFCSKCGNRLK